MLILTNMCHKLPSGVSAEVNAVTDVNLVASVQQLSLISTLRNQLEGLTQKQEEPIPPILPLKVGTDSGVECDQQNSADRCSGSTVCLNSHIHRNHNILYQGCPFGVPLRCTP